MQEGHTVCWKGIQWWKKWSKNVVGEVPSTTVLLVTQNQTMAQGGEAAREDPSQGARSPGVSVAGTVRKWHKICSVEVLQPKALAGLSKLPSPRGASASPTPGTGTCAVPPSLHCGWAQRPFLDPWLTLGHRANGMRDGSRVQAIPVGRVKLNTRPSEEGAEWPCVSVTRKGK